MSASIGWDQAPIGLLTLREDGTILAANATFLDWVGRDRAEVLGGLRLSGLLSVGGRIYWETHLSPVLLVEGRVDEVALELRSPGGRLPVLMTAVTAPATDGRGATVHVALSGARDRSRYERDLLTARRRAELAATQTRILLDVTSALSQAIGVDNVASALLDAATKHLGAEAATLWFPDGDGTLVPVRSVGETTADAPRPSLGRILHDRATVTRAGRVVVPLHGHSALRGALSLTPRDDPAAEPVDLAMVTGVGQQAGLALERARLYEESAGVAHSLQQALLASDPPLDARFAMATTYRPGVESLEVGGDWHDAFTPEADILAVVVGDVVGRGLGAAIAMGQLRSAVRALAGPGSGPAALASGLDRFVHKVRAGASATMVQAHLDLTSGHLRYSCAGHPPPLLLPAAGAPTLLWEGRSPPLGVTLPGVERTEAELSLEPGDQLLLYTDGLVERRDRSLQAGLAALTQAAAALRGCAPEETVQALTAALLDGRATRDDVCVLLVVWRGPDGSGMSQTR